MAAPANTAQEEALALLQPLQPLLAGFAHRNKNQHRGARWWASFSILRRHVDKLVGEVEVAVADSRKKKPAKKRKRTEAGGGADGKDGQGQDGGVGGSGATKAEVRASWLLDVLLPKTYIAFSQLTADNQFATLGVVLLAVLAQVNTACGHLVESGAGTTSTSTAANASVEGAAPAPVPVPVEIIADRFTEANDDAVDVGQAVSREEVARVTSTSAPEKKSAGAGPDVVAEPKPKRRKESRAVEGEAENRKKKKKKVKKGDEFDALFRSLG